MARYGTADTNVTFGLGSGGASSLPVGVAGRVSRLFSLVNATYLADFGSVSSLAGLGGLRYTAPRFVASLGLLYYSACN